MKKRIIDLLNNIAEGRDVPKKIKYKDEIYIYDKANCDYLKEHKTDCYLFDYMFCNLRTRDFINDYVEILEDKPEKIEYIKKNENRNKKINEIIDKVNYLLEKEGKEDERK